MQDADLARLMLQAVEALNDPDAKRAALRKAHGAAWVIYEWVPATSYHEAAWVTRGNVWARAQAQTWVDTGMKP